MKTTTSVDWDAVIRDERFQSLRHRKHRILWGLMAFSLAYFLLLPLGAAYYQSLFKVRLWGVVNIGLLFALSEFVIVWIIALIYSRKASQDFDRMAESLVSHYTHGSVTPQVKPSLEGKPA